MDKTPSERGARGLALHSFSYRQSSGGKGGSRYSMRLALSRGQWYITEEGKEFWSQDDEVINTYPVPQEDVDGFIRYLETVDFARWDTLPEGEDTDPDGPRAHIGFAARDEENAERYYAVSDMSRLPPEQTELFQQVRQRLQALCRFHRD